MMTGSDRERERSANLDSSARGGLCRVFVSYSRVDEADRVRLGVHLAPLVREGLIDLWSDRAIAPGSDWQRDIENELATADIVVLLVTPDFVASVHCFERELAEALRRHEDDGMCILPVIVRPVDFANMPFGRFQALPRDLRPVHTWPNGDEAWLQVARGVREAVEEIYRGRTEFPAPRRPLSEIPGAGDKSQLGQELAEYYGSSNCVVDGPVAEERGVEWIPLDEDATAMSFENLVPISSRHRDRSLRFMPGTLHRATFRFGIDLIAENVFHSARRHFHDGIPALAFGCTRLGHMLATHYPYAFETHEGDDWAFLAQSLFYLPYRMHDDLLEATLQRVRQCLGVSGDCPSTGRSALLLAIANLCQDLGRWTKAEHLYDQVLLSGPAQFVRVATLLRRTVGRIFGGATRESVDRDFDRVRDHETSADLSVSLAIAHGWWHLAQARPEQCLRRLEPFDFDEEAPCASEYIAPLLLARRHAGAIEPLASRVTGTRALTALLDATAGALLAARGTATPSRPIWVD